MAVRKSTPRSNRKRATPAEDGVKAAQRVFAKVLEKADPAAKKPVKARR